MHAIGLTAIGLVRSHNEDTIFYTTEPIGPLPNLFIVADGMGGHSAGEVASEKSVEYSRSFIQDATGEQSAEAIMDILVTSAIHANNRVYNLALSDPAVYFGMGTTFSACAVVGDTLAVAHIGDSRIYTISPDGIRQITTDHTYVEELVQSGNITREEARTHPRRNVLTRVLGCDPFVSTDGFLCELKGINHVILCSDGLTDMLTDEQIMEYASQNVPLDTRANALIDAANREGGKDNISAIIIDVKGEVY